MNDLGVGSHIRFGSGTGSRFASLSTVLALGVVFAFSGTAARAGGEDGPAGGSPDSRALRLSSSDGQVQVVQDGVVIADPATANLPLFEGSQIITGTDGRAEVQLEDGSIARISPNSTLTFTVLQQQGSGTRTEMVLNSGLAYFELQPSSAEHSLRVNYGTASFTASSFSVVRVNLDTAPGDLAVFSGNVLVDRGSALQLEIHGGQSLGLDLNDASRYTLTETIEPDSWDNWNSDREQLLTSESAEKTAATGEFVNSQSGNMNAGVAAGMSDLDASGNWYNVPGQGYVWSPYEAISAGAGWDPYGYGRWVYYPRYGYVWVSGYGWGYTPYQCGQWNFYDSFGWGWAPGGLGYGGGCNPWWGAGYGGWGYNIGIYPRGYQPPRRPTAPNPLRPIPHPHNGPHGITPVRIASVPVDRRPVGTPSQPINLRPTQPVTIAGHTVQPLRPLNPRNTYEGTASFGNRPNGGASPAMPSIFPSRNAPGYGGAHPVYPAGSRPSAPVSRPVPSSPRPSSGGGGASRPSAPMSSGGGGGGHPSGGGGSPHK